MGRSSTATTTSSMSVFVCRPDLDPLAEDQAEDLLLTISDRQLLRLLVAAADTGCRFGREGVAADPVAWLLSPRQIFGGRAAISACSERESLVRAIVLNGLSLGLDADPAYIDDLLSAHSQTATEPVSPAGVILAEPTQMSAQLAVV